MSETINVSYNYTAFEDENIKQLLTMAGYPTERFEELIISEFTQAGEGGLSTLKVTAPDAGHPAVAKMGGQLTKVHKFKRAPIVASEAHADTTPVRTSSEAFAPVDAIKTTFAGKVISDFKLKEEVVPVPDVYEYSVTVLPPDNSKTIEGQLDMNLFSCIDLSLLEPFLVNENGKEDTILFNPYAPVSNETNGGEMPHSILPSPPGYKLFMVGDPQGATHKPYPFIVLMNRLKESTDPKIVSIRNRLQTLIDTSPTNLIYYGYSYRYMTGSSPVIFEQQKPDWWETNPDTGERWGANEAFGGTLARYFDEVSTQHVLDPESDWAGTGTEEKLVPTTDKFMGSIIASHTILYKFYESIRDILGYQWGVCAGIRKKHNPEHVIDPVVEALGQSWLDTTAMFNDETKTITFDLQSAAEFETAEAFKTACLASAQEMFWTPTFKPELTATVESQDVLGHEFICKITLVNKNTDQDNFYIWNRANVEGAELATFYHGDNNEVFLVFNGKQKPSEDVPETLPGFF